MSASKAGRRVAKRLTRFGLNLMVLGGFGALFWHGCRLFGHTVGNALVGSILLIAGVVVWVALIRLVRSRRYKWIKPSFKLTAFSVIAILLILTFAGVQPMASYKDGLVTEWTTYQEAAPQREAERAARAEVRAEQREARQEAEALEIGREVVALVNTIRRERGSPELVWDESLYEHSKAHSRAMADAGELFHSPMGASWAENAWGGSGGSWTARDMVDSWMSSRMHRTWLLCPNLRHVAVGVAYSDSWMYASWTFWVNETIRADWWYQYSPDNPPDWWY